VRWVWGCAGRHRGSGVMRIQYSAGAPVKYQALHFSFMSDVPPPPPPLVALLPVVGMGMGGNGHGNGGNAVVVAVVIVLGLS
jgi:hypothetical protein